MSETEPRARRGRGRRPAAEVREQILRAAGELLLNEGMAAFTIEKVAARAGASRMTIHKWWPSRGALAIEGYFAVSEHSLEFPDTGDIRADLTAQVRALARLLSDTGAGRVISELIGAAQTDPEVAAAYRTRYAEPRRQLAVEAINRGIERGQLRNDIDPEVIDSQLWGACYHRLLVYREPLTDDFAGALVDNLLTGLRRDPHASAEDPGPATPETPALAHHCELHAAERAEPPFCAAIWSPRRLALGAPSRVFCVRSAIPATASGSADSGWRPLVCLCADPQADSNAGASFEVSELVLACSSGHQRTLPGAAERTGLRRAGLVTVGRTAAPGWPTASRPDSAASSPALAETPSARQWGPPLRGPGSSQSRSEACRRKIRRADRVRLPAASVRGPRPCPSRILKDMKFRTVVQSGGRADAFLPVPPKSTQALGGGKTPAVTVTLNGHTYRADVGSVGDGLGVSISAVEQQAAGIEVGDEVDVEMKLAGPPSAV